MEHRTEGMFYTLMCGTSLSLSVAFESFPMKAPWKKNVWIKVYITAWVFGVLFAVLVTFTGGYQTKLYCMYDFTKWGNMFVGMTYVSACLACTAFFYIKVFNSLRILASSQKGVKRMAYNLMKLYAFLVACWTPACLTMIAQGLGFVEEHQSPPFDMVAAIGAVFNSAANPYFILAFFSKIRKTTWRMYFPVKEQIAVMPHTAATTKESTRFN